MTGSTNCAFCSKPATNRCSGCHNVYYCSKDHQKQHWKKHKVECNKKHYKICEDRVMGRHLVATGDIKRGEVILREKPLLRGPIQVTAPVCLGCYKLLKGNGDCKPCTKCGWPVCNERCEASVDHVPECNFTQRKGSKVNIKNFIFPHPNYHCLIILRGLYLRDNDPAKWEKLMKLESHCESRKQNSELYEKDKLTTQFIRNFFKLEKSFTEEEIMKLAGIVQVNGHEVPLKEPHIAIYETVSMLEHNCTATCSKSFTEQGDVVIAAGVPIAAGDHISISYTDPLWGTSNRRHYLSQTKFFDCECKRCSDPTEFGTMFDAMKCKNGDCSGYLLPKSFLTENSNNNNTSDNVWYCNKCEKTQTWEKIQEILEHIGKDLQAMEKGNIACCQKFLDHYSKILHPNHFYMTDVRIALAQLIGQENEGGLANSSDDAVNLKARLCQQVADLLKTITPAEVRVRGTVLFELHAAVAEIARRKSVSGESGPELLEAMLSESQKILTESAQLLKNEPFELPEGKIGFQAKKNLVELETLLKSLHIVVGDTPI